MKLGDVRGLLKVLEVFLSELKKKEQRVEESYITYEHWGMVKEDVKTTTSHMIQTEVDKNKDGGVSKN